MEAITLTLTDMANGGVALGRDENKRVIFVPFAIPGETVQVAIDDDRKRFARGRLVKVLSAAPERAEARCPHFGPCGGCHFQHIDYPDQLRYKEQVIRDQLERIGKLTDPPVESIWANPEPWAYADTVTFSPTADGRLGFWSPQAEQVIPIDTCLLLRPPLLDLYQDLDLDLPTLRSLTLRVGIDDELLAALETDGTEPPSLETDFPVSAALLLPDGTVANLIGDNFVLHAIAGRLFRVSAGCFFRVSQSAVEFMVETVLSYATLRGSEIVLELYSGVGTLTAFLAPKAAELVAVEMNPDAVSDAAANLEDIDSVNLYQGHVEEVLPFLTVQPDLIIVDPPAEGLPRPVMDEIVGRAPSRLLYISSDVATLARDGERLSSKGYKLVRLQPIDMQPQTFHVLTVSEWRLAGEPGS